MRTCWVCHLPPATPAATRGRGGLLQRCIFRGATTWPVGSRAPPALGAVLSRPHALRALVPLRFRASLPPALDAACLWLAAFRFLIPSAVSVPCPSRVPASPHQGQRLRSARRAGHLPGPPVPCAFRGIRPLFPLGRLPGPTSEYRGPHRRGCGRWRFPCRLLFRSLALLRSGSAQGDRPPWVWDRPSDSVGGPPPAQVTMSHPPPLRRLRSPDRRPCSRSHSPPCMSRCENRQSPRLPAATLPRAAAPPFGAPASCTRSGWSTPSR